ncbi:MAG TPA: hypothetical protein P5077_13290, partial [bacterium]|nr:hypothetical protein [bacterium]
TIDEGQGLTLDGSGSFDPDTACGDAIVTYAWDLDHDDIFDDCFGELCVISDAQSVAFGWHEGNTYAIALKVTDSTGKVSNVSETTIKVDSVCGNNFKAPSEECDDGNNEDGDCCAAGCTFEIIGASCGDGATVCSAQDTCDGAGLCLPNHLSGTPCTDDDLFCTGAETCTDGICGSAGDPCGVDLFCDEDMDACINSREEQCDIDNGNPPNSSDTIANVTIRYTTAGGWTSPADCAWGCNADYAEDGVSLDTSFDPDVNGDVWSIALQPDGKILLGGDFTAVGGVARNHIARLNADGTLDTTFDPNANGTVYAIAAQPDGGVLVGGAFTTIGGETRHYLARLGDDGLLDTTFDPEPNDWVMFIAAPSDGTILVGGAFHTIGGQAMKFMARLNADGTADASFDPALNSTVFFITTQTDGKILVGGTFTSAGIETRNHIARLNADGTLDTTFDPGEVNGDVYSLAVQADGMILVSGGFTAIGGETRNHLARLNEDGLLDTTFDPDPNNYTVSIALQTDGKVLASGFFTSLGGQTRNGIARLNIDGTVDTTIDPDANGTVRFVAVQPDGKILAGGAFTAIGGQPRNRMARINPDALCINSKEVPCDTDNGNPENSSDTIANVTITYSTAGGWTLPADCAWTCDTDFALEDGACINEKQVPCDTDNDNPENSSDTIANVTILYTTDGGWELPADCAWTCDTDFALEGGDCINQKEVPCDEDNGNPVNSSDIIANVTIHYTTEGGWELPADCDWACDTDFAEEGGACINQKDVSCDEDNGNPVNSSNTIADVTIHYTTDGGWELPPDCAWTCDDGFFLNGEATACVECFVDGDCADGNACNGEELCDDLG